MRLETAVTERDKKLLYGAGLAAAVLLYGVFALSPAAGPRRGGARTAAGGGPSRADAGRGR